MSLFLVDELPWRRKRRNGERHLVSRVGAERAVAGSGLRRLRVEFRRAAERGRAEEPSETNRRSPVVPQREHAFANGEAGL